MYGSLFLCHKRSEGFLFITRTQKGLKKKRNRASFLSPFSLKIFKTFSHFFSVRTNCRKLKIKTQLYTWNQSYHLWAGVEFLNFSKKVGAQIFPIKREGLVKQKTLTESLFWKQNILNPWYKFFNKNVFYKIIVPKALSTYSDWTYISIGHIPNSLLRMVMCPTPNVLQYNCLSYPESTTQSPKSS